MKVTWEFSVTEATMNISTLLHYSVISKGPAGQAQKAPNMRNLFFLHVCVIDSAASRHILTLGPAVFVVSPSPKSVAGLGNQFVPTQAKNLQCIHQRSINITSSDASLCPLSKNYRFSSLTAAPGDVHPIKPISEHVQIK